MKLQALTKLGAKMVSKPSECTYLVVKNLGRTEKFLCAMAVAPYVVTEKWALASAAAKQLLRERSPRRQTRVTLSPLNRSAR